MSTWTGAASMQASGSRSRLNAQRHAHAVDLPMKPSHRLEMIVRRQRSGRRRDLFFACFVALVVTLGVFTVGARVFDASTYVAQR
jgi:hypothetical protein